MIVMKKVRSGTYYTGHDRDGYASVEREGVRLGLEFVWCESPNEESSMKPPEPRKPEWQAWKITGADVWRRRRVWKILPGDEETPGSDEETPRSEQKPWIGQRKTFGLMAIPAVDVGRVAETLDHIVRDGLMAGKEETGREGWRKPGMETGFLVIDREGELVTLSVYGADPHGLFGKTAYEKIQRLMDVLTGRLRPAGKPPEPEKEIPLPTRQMGKGRPWMEVIAVRPESIHRDRRGTDNVWWGGLAARLGVEGAVVGHDDLELALNGYVPGLVDGKPVPIMSNAGHPRRKKGTDVVFSAPKAYSLLWAQSDATGRKELELLNRETVRNTLAWWVEKGLGFTEEDNGRRWNHERELLIGLFEHGSSREKDPHLHTHCIVVNLTGNGRRLVVNNRYALAADYEYRRGLCAGLQRMGFPAFPSLGQGLGVKGITDEDEEKFSRRRQMILEMAQGRGPQVRRRIALLTRGGKVQSRDEIRTATGDWWENGNWNALVQSAGETMGQPATELNREEVSARWSPELPDYIVPGPDGKPPAGLLSGAELSEPKWTGSHQPDRRQPKPHPEMWPDEKVQMEKGHMDGPVGNGNGALSHRENPSSVQSGSVPAAAPPDPDTQWFTPGNDGESQSGTSPSPLDVLRTITLNRGQVVALDDEVIALARLMHTRGGQSPEAPEIRQWLSKDNRITPSPGYWIETHLSEMDRRCREKIKSMLRDNRLTIVDEQEERETGENLPDVCWLSPGDTLPEKYIREQQGIRYIGLRRAHWWPANRLEPLLDNIRERIILKMPLDGPRIPGYPARELWWNNATDGWSTVEMSGRASAAEKETAGGQLALPLQPRKRARTGQGRNMKDGYYQNACGFHATLDEFVANFGYDVMLQQRAVMVSDSPAEWEPVIERKLLDMGIIGDKPMGQFKGLSWRMNERVGWQPQTWKRKDWLWGEVRDVTCRPGKHGNLLWVETWKGELVPLKEDDVRNIRCGYVVHPSEIGNGAGLRCHYYFPRPADRSGSQPGGERRSGQERRKEIAEAMQNRPVRGQLFIGVEPYRKRWHAPPHARFLQSEKQGLPEIGPTGMGSNRKILGLVRCLSQLGGGTWRLVDKSGETELTIVPRQDWNGHEAGQEWEIHVLESVEAVTSVKNRLSTWFLQWKEKSEPERKLVVRVESVAEWLAMRQGGLSMELITRVEDGYEIWMKWPRYERQALTPEAFGEYLRQVCGVERFTLLERGEVPDRLWKCAVGNGSPGDHELPRLPVSAWEKMRQGNPEIKERHPGIKGI